MQCRMRFIIKSQQATYLAIEHYYYYYTHKRKCRSNNNITLCWKIIIRPDLILLSSLQPHIVYFYPCRLFRHINSYNTSLVIIINTSWSVNIFMDPPDWIKNSSNEILTTRFSPIYFTDSFKHLTSCSCTHTRNIIIIIIEIAL